MNIKSIREQGKQIGRQMKQSELVAAINFVSEAQKENTIIDNITIIEHAHLFPAWSQYWTGEQGSIVTDDGKLYKALDDIDAKNNTKPSSNANLWQYIGNPSEEYQEWAKPISVLDAYVKDDKVTYNGKKYVSKIDDNIYEPDVHGWKKI